MKRSTVEHHDQGICGFAVDVLKLELGSAAGFAGGELDVLAPFLSRLRRPPATAGSTATSDGQQDQPADGASLRIRAA